MTRELTYREIIKEFLFFLKKENAYKEYIKAIKQYRKKEFRNWENCSLRPSKMTQRNFMQIASRVQVLQFIQFGPYFPIAHLTHRISS